MDRFDDDTLFAELRELRPKPRPKFTAELDERAAAGFPRRLTRAANPRARVRERWLAMSSRRRLIPVLGVALTAVVVATLVIAAAGRHSYIHDDAMTSATSGSVRGEEAEAESGTNIEVEGGEASAEEASPEIESAEKALSSGGAIHGPAPLNAKPGYRDIERSAYVVLGTKPGEVAGAAAKVYEAVHAANGVVLHSSVQSGSAGATGASFELLIPSAKLDDALAAFSSIAEVRERHDATNDITAPTVGAAEELRDSNASIEGLLKELGDVETEAERESVEARLREERRHHAAIRASLAHLHKRASMSEVSVRIVTDDGAGVTPVGSDSGNWGVGDALHDAGHILTIAAGVVLIGLAVLAPIALIALLFWAGNRFRVRRLRERTLG